MNSEFLIYLLPIVYLGAIAATVIAIREARTSQGAIAWAVSLITLPYLALPLFLVFGRRRFYGYVSSLRRAKISRAQIQELVANRPSPQPSILPDLPLRRMLERLSDLPFSAGNQLELLVDGQRTFTEMFAAIDSAKRYLLVQFYIVRDDEIGLALQERLLQCRERGVEVYFLYDEIGSFTLSESFLSRLVSAGCFVSGFRTTRGRANRFQLNFRNHRKIVVVDGTVALLGGFNVGDEYLGKSTLGRWRDTHLKLSGPAAAAVQLAFLRDWHWATDQLPNFIWSLEPKTETKEELGEPVLILPTGPETEEGVCELVYLSLINAAVNRVWISSPYFVPNEVMTQALRMAALRGVDVRVLLPERVDHSLVYLAAFSYLPEMVRAGVRIMKYQPGFLHQKAMVVDDYLSLIGTANLDNRSFRLNFEILAVVWSRKFATELAQLFEADFLESRVFERREYEERNRLFRGAVDLARLFAPIL